MCFFFVKPHKPLITLRFGLCNHFVPWQMKSILIIFFTSVKLFHTIYDYTYHFCLIPIFTNFSVSYTNFIPLTGIFFIQKCSRSLVKRLQDFQFFSGHLIYLFCSTFYIHFGHFRIATSQPFASYSNPHSLQCNKYAS